MVLLKEKKGQEIPESVFLRNPAWLKGYRTFSVLLKKPLGWLFLPRDNGNRLMQIDRKEQCSWFAESGAHQKACETYLLARKPAGESAQAFTCHAGRSCAAYSVKMFNGKDGTFFACNLKKPAAETRAESAAFHEFLKAEFELARKDYELQNMYETVHPKALALSTMHAVHRVISTAFNIEELLPRIARLSMQILKAKAAGIYLLDPSKKFFASRFSTEQVAKDAGRKLTGIEGKVAKTGEIHFSNQIIAVPFVDQDVLGVLLLKNKENGKPFTVTDLEILRILSEQTVTAIKNAQLYAETQELTLGSIRSIADLLKLDFSGENIHQPMFGRLVRDIGTDMGLSRRDLVDLDRAVYLLDTGYIGLPDAIIHKKSTLTDEEFKTIKEHPHRGADVLKSITSLKPLIPIILHHHERYDGKGYPQGLKGEDIPLGARIVAVVDSFTAMISARPYRRKKEIEEAVEEIRKNRGTQFDPKVVDSFLKAVKHL